VVPLMNLLLRGSCQSQGRRAGSEANTKEQGNHKRTTTKTIDLESAAASVGHHASLCVERDPVELLLQTQRIQIPPAYRDDLSMRKLAEATSQRHHSDITATSRPSCGRFRVERSCRIAMSESRYFILLFYCSFWSCQILPIHRNQRAPLLLAVRQMATLAPILLLFLGQTICFSQCPSQCLECFQ
jgi:hypothetical protein